jgi:hypothetical protein
LTVHLHALLAVFAPAARGFATRVTVRQRRAILDRRTVCIVTPL